MAFSKFKALLRAAAARTIPDPWQAIANAVKQFKHTNAETTSKPQDTMQVDRKLL